jgi:AraC-like DNA-binding protein
VLNPIPNERVAEYVERILVIDNYSINLPFALPLFANGTPTLLFLTTKASIDGNATNHLTLFGQTVFPETLTIREDFTLIAYFFKPFALFSLFGVSAKELTDFPIDLDLLHPSQANELKERLLNAGTTNKMITLLDDYIFDLITRSKAEIQLIQFATSIIANNPSKESLLNVQKELRMTERTFERLFDKKIGVSPTLYRRICQFNAAFQQLNNRRFGKLTDVAFENGYADQSHFIRVFREFTNITPKEYLRYGRQDPE